MEYEIMGTAALLQRPAAEWLRRAGEAEYRALFRIQAAAELPEHGPSRRAALQSRQYLETALEGRGAAVELLSAMRAYGKPVAAEELKPVLLRAAALGRTPLLAELSERAALPLWRACGGWPELCRAAGLEALNGAELARAGREYAVAEASPLLMDPAVRAQTGEAGELLLAWICQKARRLGRAPVRQECPAERVRQAEALFGSWKRALDQVGLSLPGKREYRTIMRGKHRRAPGRGAAALELRQNL